MSQLVAIALLLESFGCTTLPSAEREQQLHDLEAEFRALYMTIYGPESPLVRQIATMVKQTRSPKLQARILGYGTFVSSGTLGAPEQIAELATHISAAARHTLITEDLKAIIGEVQRMRFEGRHDKHSLRVADHAMELLNAHGKRRKQLKLQEKFVNLADGPEQAFARFAAGPVANNELRRRIRFLKECQKSLDSYREQNNRHTRTELLQRLEASGVLSEEI